MLICTAIWLSTITTTVDKEAWFSRIHPLNISFLDAFQWSDFSFLGRAFS